VRRMSCSVGVHWTYRFGVSSEHSSARVGTSVGECRVGSVQVSGRVGGLRSVRWLATLCLDVDQ